MGVGRDQHAAGRRHDIDRRLCFCEPDRFGRIGDGAIEIAPGAPDHRAVGQRLRQCRVEPDRLVDVGQRAVEIAELGEAGRRPQRGGEQGQYQDCAAHQVPLNGGRSGGYRFVAPRGAGVQAGVPIHAGRKRRDFPRWADGGRTARPSRPAHQRFPNPGPMKNDQILSQITRVLPPGRYGGDDVRPPGRQ